MPTATYTLIASTVLTTTTATITFASLPQTYRDLVLVTNTLTNNANGSQVEILFNNSTSNYYYEQLRGNASTISAVYSTSSGLYINNEANSGPTSTKRASAIAHIFDYSTSSIKTILTRAGRPNDMIEAQVWKWPAPASATAITEIDVTNASGYSYVSGSEFYLYGIVG